VCVCCWASSSCAWVFLSVLCYACCPGIVAWVWFTLLSCSFSRWVASYIYYRCDVSCGVWYIVGTVLCSVPSVVVIVSEFYCRRVGYGVLVVGCVSWGLCWVFCLAYPVQESVCVKQTPVQDRQYGKPGTVPKTHNRQLGHHNPPANNKIQKQQPWQMAHCTARFLLYTVRCRIHRTYNRNTTLTNDWNYMTTGTTTLTPQSRDRKHNTTLTRTTHTQLDDAQHHTCYVKEDQLTVSQHH